ncbi:unnamed protein product [Amoebophrya sp. A25]|nr:unnamed protein product [Amoebophrya sp. A25]|eukprot:GSA25T00018142001.1
MLLPEMESETAINLLAGTLRSLHLEHLIPKERMLAHFYLSIKIHKLPLSATRGITGATAFTFLGGAALELHLILKSGLNYLLRTTWKGKCFRILNTDELLIRLSQLGTAAKSFYGFDFSSMYDRLKHESILQNLTWFFAEWWSVKEDSNNVEYRIVKETAYNSKKKEVFYCLKKTESLDLKTKKASTTYTFHGVIDLLHMCIRCNLIHVSELLFLQIIGIPQGSGASPMVADIWCATHEVRFCRQRPEFIFHDTGRFMDDLISSVDLPVQEIYGSLPIDRTCFNAVSTSFLDLEVATVNNRVVFKLFDKRRSFNFLLHRFTPKGTTIPNASHSAHFKSALIRAYRLNSFLHFFCYDMTDLIGTFLFNGTFAKDYIKTALVRITQKYFTGKWISNKNLFIDRLNAFGLNVMSALTPTIINRKS